MGEGGGIASCCGARIPLPSCDKYEKKKKDAQSGYGKTGNPQANGTMLVHLTQA